MDTKYMENIKNLLNQVADLNKKNEEILDATGGRFNIFRVCGVNHYENTHSAIIKEFLDPKGSHGLKEKLLDCFIEILNNEFEIINFNCGNVYVCTEHSTQEEGRIDIFLEDNQGKVIIIENKIYAGDQQEQLKRYNKYAKGNYGEGNYQILYLTLDGSKASKQSAEDIEYFPISYKETIIKWLDKCVAIATRHPMVRETINQYINHLKSLTNQDMSTKNQEEIVKLLCKPENLESVFAIGDNFAEMRNYMINKVFLPKLTDVCKELKLENISKEEDRVNKAWLGFIIRKPSWKFFQISIAFGTLELGDLRIGVNHKEGKDVSDNEAFQFLIQHYAKYKNHKFWAHKNFPTYSYWGKDAMLAILSGDMSKIFKDEIEKILELTKDLDM
jgi:hypothetical protein